MNSSVVGNRSSSSGSKRITQFKFHELLACLVGGLQTVCGVRCAVCGVRCAVCGVRCAVCGVRAFPENGVLLPLFNSGRGDTKALDQGAGSVLKAGGGRSAGTIV
jgi:hypothetical protein